MNSRCKKLSLVSIEMKRWWFEEFGVWVTTHVFACRGTLKTNGAKVFWTLFYGAKVVTLSEYLSSFESFEREHIESYDLGTASSG